MIFLGFGVFCTSFLSGFSVGALGVNASFYKPSVLAPFIFGPIAGISMLSTATLIRSCPVPAIIGTGLSGFSFGNLFVMALRSI